MNLYLVLIIGLIIFTFLFYKIFLIINYKFWAYQPVFHTINLFYYIMPNHIISKESPKITRYCNFKDISIEDIFTLKDNEIKNLTKFLENNFTLNVNDELILTDNIFMSYFQGNKYKNYVGRYFKDEYKLDNNKFFAEKKLVGMITTKNLNFSNQDSQFPIYYVDNLCVDKLYRKQKYSI